MAERTLQSRIEVKTKLQPPVAGVASLVLPGLGQMLIGQAYRGILLLLAFGSGLGIYVWRIAEIGRREVGFGAKFGKAIDLEPMFFILALVVLVSVWLLIAYDYHKCCSRDNSPATRIICLTMSWHPACDV